MLPNANTGQVFSSSGSGWQAAGSSEKSSSVQQSGGSYGTTNWTGGNASQAAPHYSGRSVAGFAAWQTGHLIGRTMRFVGMGKEQ